MSASRTSVAPHRQFPRRVGPIFRINWALLDAIQIVRLSAGFDNDLQIPFGRNQTFDRRDHVDRAPLVSGLKSIGPNAQGQQC
jgi:hypothetical protein